MTKEASLLGKFGPWAGAAAAIVLFFVQVIGGHGAEKTQTSINTQDIQKLEDKKADRREVEDMKAWMKRIDDKLDKLNDKMDQRNR